MKNNLILLKLLITVAVSTFLIGWLYYYVPTHFMKQDIFRLREITIEGKSKKLTRELTNLAETLYNSNRWQINLEDIEDYLKKDIRINDIKISSDSVGTLSINLKGKTPKYYAQMGESIYLVDENGDIIGYLRDFEGPDTYFIKANNAEEIKKLLRICSIIDENILKNIVSQIYIKDKNCVEIILDDRTIIKTNFDVKQEKYKIVEILYYTLSKNKPIEYIDLRFDDFIVKTLGDVKDGK